MKVIPRASPKTNTVTLPANGTVFVFFEAESPLFVHFFDCSFVSGVKWWTHVSSVLMKIYFWLFSKKTMPAISLRLKQFDEMFVICNKKIPFCQIIFHQYINKKTLNWNLPEKRFFRLQTEKKRRKKRNVCLRFIQHASKSRAFTAFYLITIKMLKIYIFICDIIYKKRDIR